MPDDWLKPDPNQPPPAWPEDLHAMYRELNVRHTGETPPAVREYMEALRALYANGGVEFACFEAHPLPTPHFYAARDTLHREDFFTHFLKLPPVAAALPRVTAGEIQTLDFSSGRLAWGDSLTLDGELASVLTGGGAYTEYKGTRAGAKALGARGSAPTCSATATRTC